MNTAPLPRYKHLPRRATRTLSGRPKAVDDRAPSWHELVEAHSSTEGRVAKPEPSRTVEFTTAEPPLKGLRLRPRRERREAMRAVGIQTDAELVTREVDRDDLIDARARRRRGAANRARRQRKGQRAFSRMQRAQRQEADTIAALVRVATGEVEATPAAVANAKVALGRRYTEATG